MVNRIIRRKPIDGPWFDWVYEQRGLSLNGLARLTQWSARQISTSVKEQMMTFELLDACARALNVHPHYLAGKYNWTLKLEIMEDEGAKKYWLETALSPDAHPYMYFQQDGVNIQEHFYSTLILHGIAKDEFAGISSTQRAEIREKLDRVETDLLRMYFPNAMATEFSLLTFDDVFQSEADVMEYMLDWLDVRELGSDSKES